MRKIIALVLTVVISISIINIVSSKTDEVVMVGAFENVGFNIIQSDINVWTKLISKSLDEEALKKMAMEVAEQINIQKPYEFTLLHENNNSKCILTKISKNAMTQIKIESIKNKELIQNYAVIDITLYDKFDNTDYLKDLCQNQLEKIGKIAKSNVTIVGYCSGNIDKGQKEVVANKMFTYLKAKKTEKNIIDNGYNINGYSRLIDNHIISKNKKMNLDLSMNYNECEDKTYLFLATPIITVEY